MINEIKAIINICSKCDNLDIELWEKKEVIDKND